MVGVWRWIGSCPGVVGSRSSGHQWGGGSLGVVGGLGGDGDQGVVGSSLCR